MISKRFWRRCLIFAALTNLGCDPTLKSTLLTLTSIGDPSATQQTFTIPPQIQYSSIVVNLGSSFTFENICAGKTIFGRTGYASCTDSYLFRNVGSNQLTQADEILTYSGNGSTPSLPSNYREVPNMTTDDDGYNTTDADPTCIQGCTPVLAVTTAQHAAFQSCGTTQATVVSRIANCSTVNGAAASWSGSSNGTSGESTWKLVTQNGANKEVWQDQRTGMLWSSLVGSNNWCEASGNSQSSGINCSANIASFCVEILSPAIAGENWVAGIPGSYTYDPAKGGMGNGSTPGVRWRLPTLSDYEQANVDGLRFVMPDMGAQNLAGIEWASTVVSNNRAQAWVFFSGTGQISPVGMTGPESVRCVGR